MRIIFTLIFAVVLSNVFGQNSLEKPVSGIKVVYKNRPIESKPSAMLVDSVFVNCLGDPLGFKLDPERMAVDKKPLIIEGKEYDAGIYLKSKENAVFDFVTLSQMKTELIESSNKATIYFVDNKIVSGDPESYKIDRNYILKIVVDNYNLENGDKGGMVVDLVNVYLKTPENIAEDNKIYIRGSDQVGELIGK